MAKIKSKKIINIGIVIILVILVVCISLFVYLAFSKKKEGFFEPDPETGEYDVEKIKKEAVIPLHIYQTWHTKDLPPKMRECVDKLKKANPEFTHHLYDENDCREFIKNNFEPDVLDAFDRLVPTSYKSDLWRYCVLYKNGGIYLDIKYEPVNNFKFISCIDKEYFVLDQPYSNINANIEDELLMINSPTYYKDIYDNIDINKWKNKNIGLAAALIIAKPNNSVLFECIKQIVKNVKNKEYGHNSLYPTGPGLLGTKYFDDDMSKIQNIDIFNSLVGTYFITKKQIILKQYNEYRKEQKKYQNTEYYSDLWHKKQIYK
jgi:hypothetical protein